jgi:hypothetical protein
VTLQHCSLVQLAMIFYFPQHLIHLCIVCCIICSGMSSESQISAKVGQKVLIVAAQNNDLVKQLLKDAQNQVGALGHIQQQLPSTLCKLLYTVISL